MASLTAVFGGLFDPVHRGHVEPLCALLDAGVVDTAIVVPTSQAVHRADAQVSGSQRMEMLRIAYADDERVQVNDIELCKSQPSYTVLTLREFKALDPGAHLCFVLGADWSGGLDDWYQASELPLLAHLVVLNRPGPGLELAGFKGFSQACHANDLRVKPAGLCYAFDGPELDLSSTEVRDALKRDGKASGEETNKQSKQWLSNALPEGVYQYIESNGLYL
ncbi:MAG: nicotinate (nicotinamide) nucleotide adenylyltransferase [Proteobacteria bacterium]|nr:nicotinate (nicotinamide) nucleotide adenylyltransferase [Pseudomonadota bacterium]